GDVAHQGLRAYAHTPIEPAFLLEEPYDEEGPDGNDVNPSATQPVRRFQWWGFLSTIGGYISGNGYVWRFHGPWRDHLNTQNTQDMAHLNMFIRSIDWSHLVPSDPDAPGRLVTSGGNFASDGNYVAAAATPSGSLLVAYVPPDHSGNITVDVSHMAGTT